MSRLPKSLKCRRFNERGRHDITVTSHLREAVKQKAVSNCAKGFNEVRSHINSGMLSKISSGTPAKTSVIGGLAPFEIFITVIEVYFLKKTLPTPALTPAILQRHEQRWHWWEHNYKSNPLAPASQISPQTGLTSVNAFTQTVQRKWHGNSLQSAAQQQHLARHRQEAWPDDSAGALGRDQSPVSLSTDSCWLVFPHLPHFFSSQDKHTRQELFLFALR